MQVIQNAQDIYNNLPIELQDKIKDEQKNLRYKDIANILEDFVQNHDDLLKQLTYFIRVYTVQHAVKKRGGNVKSGNIITNMSSMYWARDDIFKALNTDFDNLSFYTVMDDIVPFIKKDLVSDCSAVLMTLAFASQLLNAFTKDCKKFINTLESY